MGEPELPSVPARRRDRRRTSGLGLRVLVVEDDEQVSTVLAALLETEGYEVSVAGTAEAGLRKLGAGSFHLLCTDYWLPDKTGAWMLSQASAAGLLGHCKVLVITGEHRPQGVENLIVLRKPLDLDDFLRQVHDAMAPFRQEELDKARQDVRQGVDDSVATLELVLYISTSSPSSLRALRNLNALLERYDRSAVRLTICDLSRDSGALAEEDRIAFTPTLVKRSPQPRVWILGDLENSDIVMDFLSQAGIECVK